jgi:precorrin-6Y C5,15-methyltransferase (decarboxylating)
VKPWLSIVGIGDGGLDDLSARARALVDGAEVLIGGERHLAMIPDDGRERLAWPTPLSALFDDMRARRGQRVCVLATGDPMHYGVGTTLLRHFPVEETIVVPSPSAFSLAAARMGWSLPDCECLTLHGRPMADLQRFIQPGARLLILSQNGRTPGQVASALVNRGFGPSPMVVLDHMGGAEEARREGSAADWHGEIADLNTIAVDCVAGPDARPLSIVPGLPDDVFEHDGQITKREVRAVTLSALAPLPGQLLWDVGAGCGSVAVEWMRSHMSCRAIAVESKPARGRLIQWNAGALGVARLEMVGGEAPQALDSLAAPDAVFIGGGVTADGVLEACWHALKPGGRLVANVVTLEGERVLGQWREQHGGELLRIAVERAAPMGGFTGWQPQRAVVQYVGVKP